MKYWIGRWLVGVAAVHSLFAVVVFRDPLLSILQRGLFDTVGRDIMAGLAVWFVLFGLLLFICGLVISALERTSPNPLPASLGWSLLALSILGVLLMPDSGFWLVFPPALAILFRKARVQPGV